MAPCLEGHLPGLGIIAGVQAVLEPGRSEQSDGMILARSIAVIAGQQSTFHGAASDPILLTTIQAATSSAHHSAAAIPQHRPSAGETCLRSRMDAGAQCSANFL